MHTVSARSESDIHTIIHKQSCPTAARDLQCTHSEIVKHTCGQSLLTYLDERKLCRYDILKKAQDVRSCRPAARYWIEDRTWKLKGHQIVSPSSTARQRRCV